MTSAFPQDRADAATREPAIGDVLDGYELRSVLREDGAAVVFRGHHLGLRRDAELRVLRPAVFAGDPDARQRFREAAVKTASLQHPGVVPIYAYGSNDATAWVASRLMTGPTLADVTVAAPMGAQRAAELIDQLAEALGVIHQASIVHRDVRPAAIWPFGRHVVLGLPGVARSDGATRVGGDGLLGDPQTLAPEQLRGEPATAASDVFALGAVFLSCVLGDPPFGTGGLRAVLARRATPVLPPSLRAEGRSVDELDAWLTQVLAAAPADRPRSAPAAADELRAALRALPPQVRERPGALRLASTASAQPTVPPHGERAAIAAPPVGATRVDRQRPVTPAPPAPTVRRRRGRLVALAALALAVPVLGFLAGRTSATRHELATVHAGPLTVRLDGRWSPATASTRGPLNALIAHERVLRGPAGMLAEVGSLRQVGPPLDPLAPGTVRGARRLVRLGGRSAVAYLGQAGGREVRLLVLQSAGGAGVVACTSVSPAPAAAVRACGVLAGTAAVAGRAVAPAPSPQVAQALATAMLSLHNLVATRQLTLHGATGSGARDGIADVEELYKRAIADLSAAGIPPEHRPTLGPIVGRLRAAVVAYDALRLDNRSATARAAVVGAVEGVRDALSDLRRLGYEVQA